MKFSDLKVTQSQCGTAILKNGKLEVAQIATNADDDMGDHRELALDAAELLRAFFEAKQEGKTLQLVEIGGNTTKNMESRKWYKNGREDGYQTAILEMRQAQSAANDQWQRGFDAGTKAKKVTPEYLSKSYPSDYQLRLERYAVDILNGRNTTNSISEALDHAAFIIKTAAEKSANQ